MHNTSNNGGDEHHMIAEEYAHLIDGRMRVKVQKIKRQPAHAREIENMLRPMDGVTRVDANPLTGNVLVLFDSDIVTDENILEHLDNMNYLKKTPPNKTDTTKSTPWGDLLLQAAVQIAIEKLILKVA